MIRLVVLVILLILTVTCSGLTVSAHTAATQSGLDPDVAGIIEIGLNCVLITACAIIATIMARFIAQVKLSKQILLSFFFYSWRNYVYGKNHQILPTLSIFRPRTRDKGSRPFCFVRKRYGSIESVN